MAERKLATTLTLEITRIRNEGCLMVAVESDEHQIRLTIPTERMPPEDVDRFVAWIRAEAVARQSQLTEQDASRLAEEVNAGWWERNKARFEPSDGE